MPENISQTFRIYSGQSANTTSSLLREFNFFLPQHLFSTSQSKFNYKKNGLFIKKNLIINNIFIDLNINEKCNLLKKSSHQLSNKFVSSLSTGQIATNAPKFVLNRCNRKTASSCSAHKKPLPKPRTFVQQFNNKTLPAR